MGAVVVLHHDLLLLVLGPTQHLLHQLLEGGLVRGVTEDVIQARQLRSDGPEDRNGVPSVLGAVIFLFLLLVFLNFFLERILL